MKFKNISPTSRSSHERPGFQAPQNCVDGRKRKPRAPNMFITTRGGTVVYHPNISITFCNCKELSQSCHITILEIADITPSSQPNRALSALTSGLKPSCNLSQSRYGRKPIACAHTTGDSNTNLSQVSYRNLLTTQYKQGCNQCECFHTHVYQKLNTHQLHLNAPYKHLSASVPTSPVERTN
jgi:hypothetical protein